MMHEAHVPVLLRESAEFLINDLNGIYFDATAGFGGHSSLFLEILKEKARLIATDVDNEAFHFCRTKFVEEKRYVIYNYNFSKIDLIAKIENIKGFNGIFADLGVSSYQLDNPDSGFTYRLESPLDLRLDKNIEITGADIVNEFSVEELSNIFYKYGEEKRSRKIANEIAKRRIRQKIKTTTDISEIVYNSVPEYFAKKTLSRIFQALRIYINNELKTLEDFLNKSADLLNKDGRIVILTYHSLEDRIVKDKFKFETLKCVCPSVFPECKCGKKQRFKILTKKPILPSDEEFKKNKRSQSAKLRAAVKL